MPFLQKKNILQLIKKSSPALLNEIKIASALSNKKWDLAIKGLTKKQLVKVTKNAEDLFVEMLK